MDEREQIEAAIKTLMASVSLWGDILDEQRLERNGYSAGKTRKIIAGKWREINSLIDKLEAMTE